MVESLSLWLRDSTSGIVSRWCGVQSRTVRCILHTQNTCMAHQDVALFTSVVLEVAGIVCA